MPSSNSSRALSNVSGSSTLRSISVSILVSKRPITICMQLDQYKYSAFLSAMSKTGAKHFLTLYKPGIVNVQYKLE